jgi:hypothetical protein
MEIWAAMVLGEPPGVFIRPMKGEWPDMSVPESEEWVSEDD